ncbi:MAG: DnaJ domain-containing protein [Pseudomonadota bacterium]
MADLDALQVAIDIFHIPARIQQARRQPLPAGVPWVLQICTQDEDALAQAAAGLNRQPDLVQQASAFFVEQILFDPSADSYRTLGVHADADVRTIRQNMALLMRWLHPDVDEGAASNEALAARVTNAWETLKTPEKRAQYDASLASRAVPLPTREAGDARPRKRRRAQGDAAAGKQMSPARPGVRRSAWGRPVEADAPASTPVEASSAPMAFATIEPKAAPDAWPDGAAQGHSDAGADPAVKATVDPAADLQAMAAALTPLDEGTARDQNAQPVRRGRFRAFIARWLGAGR